MRCSVPVSGVVSSRDRQARVIEGPASDPEAQAVAADATAHVRDLSGAADIALGVLTGPAQDAPLAS
jgi:hypothetical protein